MKRSLGSVVVGVVALVAVAGIGYAIGDDGHAPTHGLDRSSMAQMMMRGSLQRTMSDHVEMLEGMRMQMTPEMRAELDADEMWKMMESGDFEKMMDELGHMMAEMPGMGDAGSDRHGHRDAR